MKQEKIKEYKELVSKVKNLHLDICGYTSKIKEHYITVISILEKPKINIKRIIEEMTEIDKIAAIIKDKYALLFILLKEFNKYLKKRDIERENINKKISELSEMLKYMDKLNEKIKVYAEKYDIELINELCFLIYKSDMMNCFDDLVRYQVILNESSSRLFYIPKKRGKDGLD